jgi:hypothetical protein
VSLFKTGKPIKSWIMALEKGSEETVGVKEIAFSTFGEAPIARLGYSLGLTDCLVGSSREGTVRATLATQAPASLGKSRSWC